MENGYTLYGSYASYYTAKTRSYLRKKGIPFVERLPSDPMFRNKVRPASGSHRIPQLLTPEGNVIQDSVEIQDYLEVRFPNLPAIPDTPRQRVFVHLMELMASEGLIRLAWLHRWMFEENDSFVKKDFGRSFRPQGSDEDLLKYGNLIAERMTSYGLPESTPAFTEALDEQYLQLLSLFEAHLLHHPYFLGGHPSAADYAIMGAMHAHLGRDPAGLRVMQHNAPRVFRWVEHMIVPEVRSPEFASTPVEYLAEDVVPETSLAILGYIAREYGGQFVLGAIAFNQAMARLAPSPGYELNPDVDQPALPPEQVLHEGIEHSHAANLHGLWLTQRAQGYFQSLSKEHRVRVERMLGAGVATNLINVPLTTTILRRNNRLVTA
ncbi:MAG: glutathione S-transferase family protein [Pseudomonadales bacterium]|jgi:glutathione S-transferase|nr:glutathione S-transferase family protein [Pseudomonadales bacterium]MDP6472557.1 glutathione S-transferase family protein [Pseudomonadales bacterium]MDP6829039.1 glutathione S-transferase family protein [Pseudomonadales bacterium]MDP6971666.1 glutathione S-transferase family protein [Pseudomonadales bacterium]|tara:strand:- start:739 stop:1875 length:1137 start_codon:yes stop_codon:yes gene_type:complete